MTNGRFGLPHDRGEGGGGPDSRRNGNHADPGGPGEAHASAGEADATPGEILLRIKGVRARESDDRRWYLVELDTTRGEVILHLAAHEGSTGVAVFLPGAWGDHRGPAGELYVNLGVALAEGGYSAVRVEYRKPGEFQECVADAMAACSFLKAFGAQRVVMVGHSFGAAVAIKAGEYTPMTTAVCSLSTQLHGTYEVDRLGKPLLLIHGSRDRMLDKAASEDVYARAGEPKQLVILDGDGHGLMAHREQVFELVEAFVREHAGAPSAA